jgi:hypothetical protein
MAGGSWDPASAKVRPGLYINFKNAAIAAIQGGARGTVAVPLVTYTGATAKKLYEVANVAEASQLFGAANIKPIQRIFKGGANKVIVYTLPAYDAQTAAQDYIDMRAAFDTRIFNVFVYAGEVTSAEQDNALAWMQGNKAEGKLFQVVFGGSAADDQNPATGNARTTRLADPYAVNLIVGTIESGVVISSAEFAAEIAGLIAGTPINKSITYAQVRVDDVSKRLTNAQIITALQAGSLVLVHDGEKVKVERGLATDKSKIRKVRAEIAIQTDITKTANDNYIGKIDNNTDGQKALIAAIKAFLETLVTMNVLTEDLTVGLSADYPSVGDKVYIDISFTEVDSMEEIYLTITVN